MNKFHKSIASKSDDAGEMLPNLFAQAKRESIQGKSDYEDYVFSVMPSGYKGPCKLTVSFPAPIRSIDPDVSPSMPDSGIADFEQESAAFQELLPHILQSHKERFIAIRDGKIIDDDIDEIALAQRLEKTHRNEFVLVRKVTPEVEREDYLESPETES